MRIMLKKVLPFLLLIAFALCFTACNAEEGSAYYTLMTLLGFDMNDYEHEVGTRFPGVNDPIYKTVSDMVSILVYDSVHITPFESTREAASGNSDAILNYMLKTSYSAYSGNSALLEEAEKVYPQYHITTLIPKADYESYVYRYFGGDTSVQHASTVRFTYLSKLGAYTTTGQAVSPSITVNVTKVVETSHTYRVNFTLSSETESVDYFSMVMKRNDGTLYMRFVREVTDEAETKTE